MYIEKNNYYNEVHTSVVCTSFMENFRNVKGFLLTIIE